MRIGWHAEAPGGNHGFAAAPAAADEVDLLLVFTELDQVEITGLLQQVQALGGIHLAGESVADQGTGGRVESHANVFWRSTGAADMFHLMPAVADAYAAVRCGLDDFAGPLVVEHFQAVIRRKGLFIYEDASQLGFAPSKQGLDEILFHVQVLVKEVRRALSDPRRPEWRIKENSKKPAMGGEQVLRSVLVLNIEQQCLVRQGV